MQVIFVIGAFIILISAVTYRNLILSVPTKTKVIDEIKSSITPVLTAIVPSATGSQIQNTPSKSPAIPTNRPSSQNDILESFIYPGAQNLSRENFRIIFHSTDDYQTITEWYKEKIRSRKMNTKSFVQTKTNENVLNVLVGSDGPNTIRVEIKKPPQDSQVSVEVKSE